MKKKIILSSALTIAMCASLVTGATYALFSSESKVNVAVSSGTVEVVATAGELTLSSRGVASEDGKTFALGGTATVTDGNKVTLENIVPGDKVEIPLLIENKSNVTIKYRTVVKYINDTGLASGLDILLDMDTTDEVEAEKFNGYAATKWTTMEALQTIGNAEIVIDFPYLTTDQNQYQNKAAELMFTVEAVQGNADVLNTDEDNNIYLYSAEELTTFARTVNEGNSYAGQTIMLASDIDLNNAAFAPIGNWDSAFEGTFDGQGYTISNLMINAPEGEGVGLFGVAQNATIKGINVKNVDVVGKEMVAAIVGSPYTGCTVSDCHVTGKVSVVAEYAYAGGIVGYGYLKVDNCSVIADGMGTITAKERNAVGGIAAWLLEDVSAIDNCQVANLEMTGWANIGGLTGFMHRLGVIENSSVENVVLTKTRVDGQPSIGLAAGGWNYNAAKPMTIRNNTFKNITLNGTGVESSSASYMFGSEYYGNAACSVIVENNNTESGIENNLITVKGINTVADLTEAVANGGNYYLAADLSVADTKFTVANGKEVSLYLNGKTISGVYSGTGNQEMFLVKGTLNVKGGAIDITATQNQGWNAMSTIFDVTAGGVLNIENATLENKAGTDMNFVVHMNNWGEVTLNVENSTLIAPYVAVRVNNSGYDMNNVTIENSTLEGKYVLWVHNYLQDGLPSSEAEINARLNINIYNMNNTFVTLTESAVRFGFTGSIYFDANGNKIA